MSQNKMLGNGEFKLYQQTLGFDDVDQLIAEIEEYPPDSLITFNISETCCVGGVSELAQIIEAVPEEAARNITKISLNGGSLGQDVKVATAVFELCRKCKKPFQLDLSESEISISFLGFVFAIIRECHLLEELNLSNNPIDISSEAYFKKSIKKRGKHAIKLLFEGTELDQNAIERINASIFVPIDDSADPDDNLSHSVTTTANYKKKELFTYNIEKENQYPRLRLECNSGRILPLKDFYCCLQCDKITSMRYLKREINSTFCKMTGETTTYKGLGNPTKNNRSYVCPICMNWINIQKVSTSEGLKNVFQCSYCLWNSASIGLIDDEFTAAFKTCKDLYKKVVESRGKSLKGLIKRYTDSMNTAKRFYSSSTSGVVIQSRDSNHTQPAFWNKSSFFDHMKSIEDKCRVNEISQAFLARYRLLTNERIEPASVDYNDEDSKDSNEGETESVKPTVVATNNEVPSYFYTGDVQQYFINEEPINRENQLNSFIENYSQEKWFPKVYERIPIKLFRGEKSIFPFFGEMQAIITKKCSDCNASLMNYEIFNSSFKKKYPSTFVDCAPIIKLYRVFRHPSDKSTIVYQFTAYNLSEWTINFVLDLDNDRSVGAQYEFGENQVTKDFSLDRKKDIVKDSTKTFKCRFQILAKKPSASQVIDTLKKVLYSRFELTLKKDKTEHVLKTTMVFELGDEIVDNDLSMRYKHQFKYKR